MTGEGREKKGGEGGRRRERRGGLSGNVAEEAFCLKSAPGPTFSTFSNLCACLRKKIKKSQESDISPICPEVPRERIFTKLGMNVPLVDGINCDKFCDNLFKGLNFTGGQSSKFSHRNLTSPL